MNNIPMNTSLKKICIFALATSIGQMVISQCHKFNMDDGEKKTTIWNADQISKAGDTALELCGIKVDKSRLKQASRKIDELKKDGDEFDILETLSFIFLGIQDFQVGRKKYATSQPYLQDLEDACLNFLTQYDPNLEKDDIHKKANEKYQTWVA